MPEAETPATQTPTSTPAPVAATPAASATKLVTIPLEDYERYRSASSEFEVFKADQSRQLAAKERERLDALADSGKHKEALEETRKGYEKQIGEWGLKYGNLEQAVHNKERDATIIGALAGREFNAPKPEQKAIILRQIHASLKDEFETVQSGSGDFAVRHKATGRPANDVLKERLDSDEFAHFFAAKNKGGAGSDATRSQGNTPQVSGLKAIEEKYFASQYRGIGLAGMAGVRNGG